VAAGFCNVTTSLLREGRSLILHEWNYRDGSSGFLGILQSQVVASFLEIEGKGQRYHEALHGYRYGTTRSSSEFQDGGRTHGGILR
jgi:hypothetical protein